MVNLRYYNRKEKILFFLSSVVVVVYALYTFRGAWLAFDKAEYMPWFEFVSLSIARLSVPVGFFYLVVKRKVQFSDALIAIIPLFYYLLQIFHTYNGYSGGEELTFFSTFIFALLPKNIKKKVFELFYWIFLILAIVSIFVWICYVANVNIGFETELYYMQNLLEGHQYYHRWLIFAIYDSLGSYRLCGVFNEPGAFGTLCALLFICTAHYSKKWEKAVLLVAGIMSFSMAFVVLVYMYIAIVVCIKRPRNMIFIALFILIFLAIPHIDFHNDALNELASRFAITSSGLSGNNRTSSEFDSYFETFLRSEDVWIGKGAGFSIEGSSSWKSHYLLRYGIIGTVMFLGLWCVLALKEAFYSKERRKNDIHSNKIYVIEYKKQKRGILIYIILFFISLYQRPAAITGILGYVLLFGGIEWMKNHTKKEGAVHTSLTHSDRSSVLNVVVKKKVVQFIHGLNTGGAETLVKNYCLGIDKSKYDVVVLCYDRLDSPYDKIITDAGIEVLYACDKMRLWGKRGVISKVINHFQLYFVLRKLLRELNPDILHIHLPLNGYVKFAGISRSTKIFETVHTEPVTMWPGDSYKKKWDYISAKYLIRHYGMRMIVLHDDMRKEVNDLFNVDNSIVLNNGIYFSDFEQTQNKFRMRIKLSIPQDAFVIGHVGRFSKVKNHSFLIDVFEEICKHNDRAFLLMVGVGEELEPIKARLERTSLINRFLILSNRSDIADIMSAMDVFVFPSIYEGLGISLIEAQKSGLPCIISDTIPDAVKVTRLVKTIPLNAGAQCWAEEVLNYQHIKTEAIKNGEDQVPADWDMKNVILRLQEIYEGEI